MNCKKGDMALVVRSAAGNEGKVVTCLEFLGRGPFTMYSNGISIFLNGAGDWWRVDRDLNMYIDYGNGIDFVEYDHSPFVWDQNLMPIGGQPVTEDERDEILASVV